MHLKGMKGGRHSQADGAGRAAAQTIHWLPELPQVAQWLHAPDDRRDSSRVGAQCITLRGIFACWRVQICGQHIDRRKQATCEMMNLAALSRL